MPRSAAIALLSGALALVACRAATPPPPAAIAPVVDSRAILAAADRSAEDRALDEGRRPTELFAFAGVKPGLRVAEIGAWKGYTAELLARAVAPDGTVYAQDPADFDKETREAWSQRATRPSYALIVRLARPFDDPFPPGTPPLDLVFCVLFYHDTVWLGVDRGRMNAALFRAVKPGGALVVVDHSARKGEGVTVVRSLHRIEESVVIDELTRAGFVLDGEGDFLRRPDDARDWNASDEAPANRRGTSDRFALRFRRP
jgi:predicted methyltransferase